MYIAYVVRNGREHLFELLTTDLSEVLDELRIRYSITDFTTVTAYHVTEKEVWGHGPPSHPTEQWYREEQERFDRARYEELRKRFG